MIEAILFIVIFKMIGASTWCFAVAWFLFGFKVLQTLIGIFKAGKEIGEKNGK